MKYLAYQSKNQNQIRKVLMHHDIAHYLLENLPQGVPIFNLNKLLDDDVTVYLMRYEFKLAGVAVFNIKNSISMIDFGFLPDFRGFNAKFLAKLVLDDYKSMNCLPIEGRILKTNKKSIHFAGWMGFKRVKNDDKYIHMRL